MATTWMGRGGRRERDFTLSARTGMIPSDSKVGGEEEREEEEDGEEEREEEGREGNS